MARNGFFVSCRICGSIGHSARNCPCAELELRKDPFGEARRIQEARDLARRPSDRLVMATEHGSLISGARRL